MKRSFNFEERFFYALKRESAMRYLLHRLFVPP